MTLAALSRTVAAAVAAVAIGGGGGSALAVDAGGPQAREGGGLQAAKASASISGVVVTDEESPRPVRRAAIVLVRGGVGIPEATVSDESGRFAFANLPAGTATVFAMKPGLLTTFYRARTPWRGPGVPIALSDGQRVTDIVLRMPPGGVVTGVVRHPSGQPLVGASVMVQRVQISAGQRRIAPVLQPSTTDDRGQYRVFGLPPGDYVVQALPRLSGIGAAGDVRTISVGEVRWAEQMVAQAATGVAPPSVPEAGPTVSYAPIYYPGTFVAAEATLVTVARGEERRGVDFTVASVPTARVRGRVVGLDGQPAAGAVVVLRPATVEAGSVAQLIEGLMAGSQGTSAADGSFAIGAVRPGRYLLVARFSPRPAGAAPLAPAAAEQLEILSRMGLGGAVSAGSHWASEDLTIDRRDVSDVQLRLQPALTVSGKVVFDGSLTPPAPSMVRLTLGPVESVGPAFLGAAISMLTGTPGGVVGADGTFALGGLIPGRYRLGVSAPMMRATSSHGEGWVVKSILSDGRDLADTPLELGAADLSGIVVTMTDRPSELTGIVLDEAGQPAPGLAIVVFSTNRAQWTSGSRRVVQTRPASDGRYLVAGLPAGAYFVAALTEVDPDDLADPAFLEQVARSAFAITLADAEKRTLDLRTRQPG